MLARASLIGLTAAPDILRPALSYSNQTPIPSAVRGLPDAPDTMPNQPPHNRRTQDSRQHTVASRKRQQARRSAKTGLPPGALVHLGEVKTAKPTITLTEYDEGAIDERSFDSIEASRAYSPQRATVWLNVYGLHDPAIMGEIGNRFALHPLVLEDILNTGHRPKVDDYGEYLFIVARAVAFDAEAINVSTEQVSIVLGRSFVLTFQERPSGLFDPVRQRLRAERSRMRALGHDYLAYELMDALVDRYFLVLETITDRAEELEDQVLHNASPALLARINQFKRETVDLRRAVWPMREVINQLIRGDTRFFRSETQPYLRDVYDHTVHVIESLDALRDLIGDMLDVYLSSVSNRLNVEVRLLTVITIIFMPATLISGIFGMNFHTMPLLDRLDGFWTAIGMMLAVAVTMGVVFWRRNWLGSRQ